MMIPTSQVRSFDQNALNEVKQGFEGLGVNLSWATISVIILVLAAAIVLLMLGLSLAAPILVPAVQK